MNSIELLNNLKSRTEQIINELSKFTSLDEKELNHRPAPQHWSILECLEHLNLYGDFYLPEIESRISKSSFPKNPDFSSGWLGNYFAKSMLPAEGKANKMNTFKEMNPLGRKLDSNVLNRFLKQQQEMLFLLEKAQGVDLTRTKTSLSISKWIKLRLGDTLRVVVYHSQRHMLQAGKVLQSLQSA